MIFTVPRGRIWIGPSIAPKKFILRAWDDEDEQQATIVFKRELFAELGKQIVKMAKDETRVKKHTPEPWLEWDACCKEILSDAADYAHARLCVNACAGKNPEAFTKLLVACKAALPALEEYEAAAAVIVAEAIALAEKTI